MGDVYNNAGRDNHVVIVQQGRSGGIGFFGTFFLVLVAWWFLREFWQVIVGAVVLLALVWVVKWCASIGDDTVVMPEVAIADRADAQHKALLEGDERTGTYGDYPPAI